MKKEKSRHEKIEFTDDIEAVDEQHEGKQDVKEADQDEEPEYYLGFDAVIFLPKPIESVEVVKLV